MSRTTRQILSYACDMLGGAFYLAGLICGLSLTKLKFVILMLARSMFPGISLADSIGGIVLLIVCGGIFIAVGTWIRTFADRIAPEREPEKSLLGL